MNSLEKKVLSENEYGFRKNRSTSMAKMDFAENITTIGKDNIMLDHSPMLKSM